MNRALYDRFSISPGATKSIHERPFFVSRTVIDPSHYSDETAGEFLGRLGVTREEYAESSVFLIRSVLMNPWYSQAKTRGRHFIAELVAELYSEAEQILESLSD
jgi:hypothetical protein